MPNQTEVIYNYQDELDLKNLLPIINYNVPFSESLTKPWIETFSQFNHIIAIGHGIDVDENEKLIDYWSNELSKLGWDNDKLSNFRFISMVENCKEIELIDYIYHTFIKNKEYEYKDEYQTFITNDDGQIRTTYKVFSYCNIDSSYNEYRNQYHMISSKNMKLQTVYSGFLPNKSFADMIFCKINNWPSVNPEQLYNE